jgi:hypothetical protein
MQAGVEVLMEARESSKLRRRSAKPAAKATVAQAVVEGASGANATFVIDRTATIDRCVRAPRLGPVLLCCGPELGWDRGGGGAGREAATRVPLPLCAASQSLLRMAVRGLMEGKGRGGTMRRPCTVSAAD